MDIFAIISLLGGLSMFLYGIEVMGDGLKNSSSSALKKVLEKVTTNTFLGVLTGTLVTAVIQSSTATIVLTVALIGAGILNLKQAVSIVMGAHIGTTVTAQIIRLMDLDAGGSVILELCQPDSLAPMALIVGIILIMFVKTSKAKSAGNIFIGFGLLFIGLMNMTVAVSPLSSSPEFSTVLSKFSEVPILGILTGLVCTVIVQSSSAMVGMLQALSSTGAMTFSLVYPIIMGINLGTCVTTAFVCSIGTGKDAKRTGIVHITFSVVGTIIFMIAMTILKHTALLPDEFWTRIVNSGNIANFQTLFNLVTCVILFPFTNQLVKLSKLIVKDDPPKALPHPELHTLDEKLFISPSVALAEATKAAAAMGALARESFSRSYKLFLNYDESQIPQLIEDEDCMDHFADCSGSFLVELAKHVQTQHENLQLNMLIQTIPNFERIGDYATNFVELAQQMQEEKLQFSDVAKQEIVLLGAAVDEITGITVEAFNSDNNDLARRIEPLEETIDDMVLILRERHTKRLKTGACAISAGLKFMDFLTYAERASDQCSSIALLMLARDNEAILYNHYDYLREVHQGNDETYRQERQRRRDQYILPLQAIQ